ncbi:cupredoxin domain-containing protein [Bacillus sp. Marseille-P3661]|uniref:cupredoxin domain-containing protein n=1 Tax=Bacillus sp. Marseille-P3661 TaxID=1936234 RepID=UPI000C841273|nr:cupredoxin domain-containing protein [Bacillus sp. Marseille-P3661]
MYTIVIRKKWIILFAILLLLGFGATIFLQEEAIPASDQPAVGNEIVLNMVTGELKTKLENGKEIESYRWDPGTIVVPKSEDVKLSIFGVNGQEHPFYIEGTDIKGVVKKGEETVVNLRFDNEGTYRLICTTHQNIGHNGPMIAYIVVD